MIYKLTKEQIAQAMERLNLGEWRKDIAKSFGVADTTLKRYLVDAELHGFAAWPELEAKKPKRTFKRFKTMVSNWV